MRSIALPVLLLAASASPAADLRVWPPEVTIGGPNRTQQLVVTLDENGRTVSDVTEKTTFATSDPAVATVDKLGRVNAVKPGEATITATGLARPVAIKVKVEAGGDWNFRNHVVPTLTRAGCNSGGCHGALAGKGGLKLSLRGYDPDSDWFVLTRQALARRVDLTNPADSLLTKKATRTMPHGGGRRFETGSDFDTLLIDWMKSGAAGPAESDAKLLRIDAFPKAALLKPKDPLRLVVRATYSDGRVEDVTRWAKFGSSEELVANVSEDGLVSVSGHGEAAINVLFGSRVATVGITSPFDNKVDVAAFANSPKNNFIDELVLKKLELLRLPPSAPCTDAEFIRRAFLDACGILPKPDEVKAFLADTDPKKRAKLVDSLLERPEFTDYWTMKWSDLLLVSSRKLPQPAMWAFYRSIRRSVSDNEPWDRFARNLVTATGSTLTNGGGNFFVMHKDISDLAESTAVTFLGMSITCARCHNHPLEKWTQDEYWAFANLFSRVALKTGDRTGEVLVQGRSEGEALHLRRGVPMPPMPLDGNPLPDNATDRRTYFADWLTSPDNPYFAKALVNRVWKNFMGRGLVEAEDDLRETNPASNRELFDALAADFIRNKFDVKHLMRTILNSAAYQRSSKPLPGNAADDRFHSRYLIRRLPAEVILDAYSDVSGVPTPFNQIKSNAGDAITPIATYPLGTRATQIPDSLTASRFLEAFGRADRVQTCSCERTADASVTQALHLNNGVTLNDKLRNPKSAISVWLIADLSDEAIMERLFLAALSRLPSAEEKVKFVKILSDAAKDGAASRREAIEDFVWAVLTGREFLFNH
ncbi:MAG: DUF1553 domain-containing protein [Gemmataceae bacterium]